MVDKKAVKKADAKNSTEVDHLFILIDDFEKRVTALEQLAEKLKGQFGV